MESVLHKCFFILVTGWYINVMESQSREDRDGKSMGYFICPLNHGMKIYITRLL